MGTQQILLIVLSVIIVGVAIAVGITMFRNQAYNSNKTAVTGELQQYASQVVQWYKTPTSQGGAGTPATITADASTIGAYLGWGTVGGATQDTTDTGGYTVAVPTETSITITGVGKEEKGGKNPQGVATITIPSCEINTASSDI
ncbi:MAG: hypothetical protein V3576_05640 [Candidatus Cloacimonadota bacterium]